MSRSPTCLSVALVAVTLGGCLRDRAADRTLTIHQMQTTDTYIGQFQIDASRLPADAIKSRVDSGGQGVPVSRLSIDQRYPIRIVLVPATDDKSPPQDPSPQKRQ
jgi:hypothetical protein